MALSSRPDFAPDAGLQDEASTVTTMGQAAEQPVLQVAGLISQIPGVSDEEDRKNIADHLDVINQNLSDPRMSNTQEGMNMVANFASSAVTLAPFAIAGAAVGGAAVAGLGEVGDLIAPNVMKALRTPVANAFDELSPAAEGALGKTSVASATSGLVPSFAGYKGAIVPQHVMENYHKENDTLNKSQALSDWAHDNYGFLIPSVPLLAAGIGMRIYQTGKYNEGMASIAQVVANVHKENTLARRGAFDQASSRFNSSVAEEGRLQSLKDHAKTNRDAGVITSEEYDWYQHYLDHPEDNMGLASKANEILQSKNIPVDMASDNHFFEILSHDNVQQIKNSVTDEVVSGIPKDQRALTEFIVHNKTDDIVQSLKANPELADALEGYAAHIDSKMESKEKNLDELNKIIFQNADSKIGESNLPVFEVQMKNKEGKKLGYIQAIKDKGIAKISVSLVDHKGIGHGKKLYKELIKEAQKRGLGVQSDGSITDEAMRVYKSLEKEGYKFEFNKDVSKFTEEFEMELTGHTQSNNPLEPVVKLISTPDNAKNYHEIVKQAEEEYNRQQAFNDTLKNYLNLAKANTGKIAKPEKAISYLKNKIEKNVPEQLKLPEVEKPVARKKAKEGETKPDELKPYRDQVEKTGTEELEKEFSEAENRFNQFEDNFDTLQTLIDCAQGKGYG